MWIKSTCKIIINPAVHRRRWWRYLLPPPFPRARLSLLPSRTEMGVKSNERVESSGTSWTLEGSRHTRDSVSSLVPCCTFLFMLSFSFDDKVIEPSVYSSSPAGSIEWQGFKIRWVDVAGCEIRLQHVLPLFPLASSETRSLRELSIEELSLLELFVD